MADHELDVIARGAAAAQALAEMQRRADKKAAAILSRLVSAYHGRTLTGEQAREGIAAIAELRALTDDLRKEVDAGQSARQRLNTAQALAGTAAGA